VDVLFTPLAERQLDALHDYIASQANEQRTDAYIGRILAFSQGLQTFAQRGASRDDVLPGLRVIGFERRVTIAFIVMTDAVLIEGVFYGGQDFAAVFRDP
jgi:toxin ParE1/3/4